MKTSPALEKVLTKYKKKLGDDIIVKASEIRDDFSARITSGSLSLDVILGGGWPANQWHEIVGEESNGKTAIALKTIAANQAKDPDFTAVWVAAEQWVPSYAIMCGVDVTRLHVIATNILEDALDAVLEITATKEVDCVVIDSLPALAPEIEGEKEMNEATVGRIALAMNKFWRKMGTAGSRSMLHPDRPFVGIMINQWRSKIGVMYGDPRTTPGGLGKNYAYFVRLEIKRDEWIEEGTGQEKHRVGQTIKLRTVKNKTAAPSQTAFVDFYFADCENFFAGEYDSAKEIVALGIINKVITRGGAYYSYGDRKWLGGDAILKSLREEIDLKEALEKDVLRSVLESSKYVAEASVED